MKLLNQSMAPVNMQTVKRNVKNSSDVKVEIESLKKVQTEIKPEMKIYKVKQKLRSKPHSQSSRLEENLRFEDKVEEINISVKKNAKSLKIQAHNV